MFKQIFGLLHYYLLKLKVFEIYKKNVGVDMNYDDKKIQAKILKGIINILPSSKHVFLYNVLYGCVFVAVNVMILTE